MRARSMLLITSVATLAGCATATAPPGTLFGRFGGPEAYWSTPAASDLTARSASTSRGISR